MRSKIFAKCGGGEEEEDDDVVPEDNKICCWNKVLPLFINGQEIHRYN
jgi:hypothetical protein